MAVKEWRGAILFLHRVVDGPADRSYGIHVAHLAGVPASVCERAEQILATLERHELKIIDDPTIGPREAGRHDRIQQLGLFRPAAEEVADQLRRTETDRLTPLEALNLVVTLRKRVSDED